MRVDVGQFHGAFRALGTHHLDVSSGGIGAQGAAPFLFTCIALPRARQAQQRIAVLIGIDVTIASQYVEARQGELIAVAASADSGAEAVALAVAHLNGILFAPFVFADRERFALHYPLGSELLGYTRHGAPTGVLLAGYGFIV